VARDLLGQLLVRRLPEGLISGRIVECEAYQEDDPASHSFHGLTDRTAVMFGPAGHLYVYFSYGMHFCMNVVTGQDGEGSAVLLRAIEPLEGLEIMRARRGVSDARILCAGPGRLTQAFGITRAENGMDLASGADVYVEEGDGVGEDRIDAGPRIGISVATARPWRFWVNGSPFVSRGASPNRNRAPRDPVAKEMPTGKVGASGTAMGSAKEGGSRRKPSA
jgi:DNA-3-methyladenine glycosylase